LIEHLRVDDPAWRHIQLVGAEALQEWERIASLDRYLAEGGHVEQANTSTHGQMLFTLVVEPVLPFPAVAIFARLPVTSEPVRPFPSRNFAEDRAACPQMLVQGRATDAARAAHLAIRKMLGIEQAKRFGHALAQIKPVLLERLRAPDIDLPQVEGRFAIVHP